MFRQISKAIFPTLEKDLSASMSKSVNSMQDLMLMAPRVYSYQKASGAAGAFGRTMNVQSQNKANDVFVKVEKKVVPRGFFE